MLQNTQPEGRSAAVQGQQAARSSTTSRRRSATRAAPSDLNPIETTTPQDAVPTRSTASARASGSSDRARPTRSADQWVLSDRCSSTCSGRTSGTTSSSTSTIRRSPPCSRRSSSPARGPERPLGHAEPLPAPSQIVNVNMNYFAPGMLGGDHAFKFGGYWRDNYSYAATQTAGNATARFPTSADTRQSRRLRDAGGRLPGGADPQTARPTTTCSTCRCTCRTPSRTAAARCSSAFATIAITIRRSHRPFRPARSCRRCCRPSRFAGVDPGIVFNNFSPRLGFTYDLTGDGKTMVRANYAMYWGQVGDGGVVEPAQPGHGRDGALRWVDANHDGFVQPNEIYDSKNVPLLANGNPANFLARPETGIPPIRVRRRRRTRIDPNLKNDRTDEFIVGVDREIGAGFAVGANYIWRNYLDSSARLPRLGAAQRDRDRRLELHGGFLHAAGERVPGRRSRARRSPTTSRTSSSARRRPDNQHRQLQPCLQRRRADRPQADVASLADEHQLQLQQHDHELRRRLATHGLRANIALRNGYQYDYLTAGSGIGNVYINAKWLYKLSGLVNLPWRSQRLGVLQRAARLSVRALRPSARRAPTAPARSSVLLDRSARAACRTTRTSTCTSIVRSRSER